MSKIVVIGSSNTDFVIKTERIPEPSETVMGGVFMMAAGGKGANQAVAAARLGGDAIFVSKVGDDIFGRQAIDNYKKDGLPGQYIISSSEAATGVATITIDKNGENSIVVAPGANNLLCPADIDKVAAEIAAADYLLLQLEIPMETVTYAAKIAFENGTKVVLNPAPAATLPQELISYLYLITPNCKECQLISGVQINNEQDARKAAEELISRGVKNVIVTLGSKGSIVVSEGKCTFVEAQKVKAVDTTAAGDVFNGAAVVALSEGLSLEEAARFATKASAIAVTRMGAQPSIPYRKEI